MGKLTAGRKLKIRAAVGNRCEIPRCKSKAYEVHHIKPSTEKGEDVASNLIVLCANHHDDADKGRITRTKLRNIVKNRNEEVKREVRNILRGGVKTGPKYVIVNDSLRLGKIKVREEDTKIMIGLVGQKIRVIKPERRRGLRWERAK